MNLIEQMSAYSDQLLRNPSVQDDLDRALSRARMATRRAKQQKNVGAAALDEGVRIRLQQSLEAVRSAAEQVRRGPEIEQRRRRNKPVLVAGAVLCVAIVAVLYGDVREQLTRATSKESQEA